MPPTTAHSPAHSTRPLPPAAARACLIVGIVGLGVGIGLAFTVPQGMQRFLFAYLVAFLFFLTLSLGALFFLAMQHITRSGWSVAVRRPAEILGAQFPHLALLALPILAGMPLLYRWVHPGEDTLVQQKSAYLNPAFFTIRLAVYLAVWSWLGRTFWKTSLRQDATADTAPTLKLQKLAPLALLLLAITVNFASFDLLMSLDPHWYSTIFGVYVFAGCMVVFFAGLILSLRLLQGTRCLGDVVTDEHYHDLGKWLFAFVFFWGYIAFSQYMLIWYGNMPEETIWYIRRGAATGPGGMNAFSVVLLALVLGHFLLPFAGLIGRSVKRSPAALTGWCILLLVMHAADLFWLARPELPASPAHDPVHSLPLSAADALCLGACLLGVGGLYLSAALRRLGSGSMVPVGDPRLKESLAFEQSF